MVDQVTPQTAATAQPRGRTRMLVLSALVAAMLSASAYLSVPLGQVPVTLQVFVVVLAALLLSPRGAFAAVGIYLALGLIGVPVFAGAMGGPGVILGPTGGYLLGFLLGAPFGARLREGLWFADSRTAALVADAVGAAAVIAVVYFVGWAQLAAVTGMSAFEALTAGVIPFAALDAAKAAAAIGTAAVLRRAGV